MRLMKLKSIAILSGLFICMQFALMADVCAYLDPSAMTYVIQIVAGAVIAGGAAITIYWKKIRLAFKKKKRISNAARIEKKDDQPD